jgi:hypothetical protein
MTRTRSLPFVAALVALLALPPSACLAAWPTDPLVNVPLCQASGAQTNPAITTDGAGGAIVAWEDLRGGGSYDLHAQRVSASGAVLWTAGGIALCTATGDQRRPVIASDGAGGALVAWSDLRGATADLYVQRISAGGVTQWTTDGIALCALAGDQTTPVLLEDGVGGAFVIWVDGRGGDNQIYAQRISAAGAALWTAGGVALTAAAGTRWGPVITTDGASGAIVTWYDHRSGTSDDIYAQRISPAGAALWTTNGVVLCDAPANQASPVIVHDGTGGAVVAWSDYRSGDVNLYAQRISAEGVTQWTGNGVLFCGAPGSQGYPTIATDDAHGAIVAWSDARSSGWDIYAQRLDAGGTLHWADNGVALCVASGSQGMPKVLPDGAGGAIVAWHDSRVAGSDIYAQRISAEGVVHWATDGVALCTASGSQTYPAIVADGVGGIIAAWADLRGADSDIYAQSLKPTGGLGSLLAVPVGGATALALEPLRPNPLRGGPLTVRFTLASDACATIELLDVAGRRVAARDLGGLGPGHHAIGLDVPGTLAPGLYLVRLRQEGAVRQGRLALLR